MAEEGLVMRENVNLVVLGILVIMQASAVGDIGVPEVQDHSVLPGLFEEDSGEHYSVLLKSDAL